MSSFYKNGIQYLRYTKQLTYKEIIENYQPELDFIIQLIKLIENIKSQKYNSNYSNLLGRQICNSLYKYFPKKYDYIKEVNNKDVLIHYKTKENEIEYQTIENIDELEIYLKTNEEFIRDHIYYRLDIGSVYNNDFKIINQINKYIINNSNDYNINQLLKEYNQYCYSNILEFIFVNLMYKKITDDNIYNKFYHYASQIIQNKKILEIKNINEIFDNFELLFCNQEKIISDVRRSYDCPYVNVHKININIMEKVFEIIQKLETLPDLEPITKSKEPKEPKTKDKEPKTKDKEPKTKDKELKTKDKELKDKELKTKKQTIPKPLKKLVWNKYIGEDIGKAKCLCCKLTDITQLSFHCGHIIAESNGGELNLNNLKPICNSCNSSMGKQNMDEFIMKYKL
jgi:5-methylcytosine-specific restriction endonuclease McrA